MKRTLLPVTITAFIEKNDFGNIVEFSFYSFEKENTEGQFKLVNHSFIGKWQSVSEIELTVNTKYPIKGFLIVEILKENTSIFDIRTPFTSILGQDFFTVDMSNYIEK